MCFTERNLLRNLLRMCLPERFREFKASSCFPVCFFKAFPKGGYLNLDRSVIWIWLECSISLPIRYSCLV